MNTIDKGEQKIQRKKDIKRALDAKVSKPCCKVSNFPYSSIGVLHNLESWCHMFSW